MWLDALAFGMSVSATGASNSIVGGLVSRGYKGEEQQWRHALAIRMPVQPIEASDSIVGGQVSSGSRGEEKGWQHALVLCAPAVSASKHEMLMAKHEARENDVAEKRPQEVAKQEVKRHRRVVAKQATQQTKADFRQRHADAITLPMDVISNDEIFNLQEQCFAGLLDTSHTERFFAVSRQR